MDIVTTTKILTSKEILALYQFSQLDPHLRSILLFVYKCQTEGEGVPKSQEWSCLMDFQYN